VKIGPGTKIGPYEVVEQIGRGGMATVYKAHQPALARFVAIKVLPDFFVDEPGFKERFQREAVSVAKLRHSNILAVFDYGDSDGITYIVNEFIDGGTLADQVGNPLPIDYTTQILAPIASALDYAHARGVLHRDLKPSNILLSHDGTPILGDFGLAKMLGQGGPGLTQSGMVVGTPEYMAPEQCEGKDLTPGADIYALGVVAYEMLTGRPPFTAETPAAVIMAQIHNQLPSPRSIYSEVPPAVEAALLKSLAREPGDRPRSASQMVRGLAEADRSPGPIAVIAIDTPAPPAPQPPPSYPLAEAAQPPAPAAEPPAAYPSPPPSPAPLAPPSPPPTPVPPPPAYPSPPYSYPPPTPPPTYEAPTAYQTPSWPQPAAKPPTMAMVCLGIGAGLSFIGSLALLALTNPDTTSTAALIGLPSLALLALHAVALFGVARGQSWGKGVGTVVAVAWCLTCVGAALGIPLLISLWSKPASN
jgi:serine/threonine-protein kinase